MNTDACRFVTPDARPLFMIADAIPEFGSFADIDRYLRVDVDVARKDVDCGKIVLKVRVQGIKFKEVSGAAVPNEKILVKPRHG